LIGAAIKDGHTQIFSALHSVIAVQVVIAAVGEVGIGLTDASIIDAGGLRARVPVGTVVVDVTAGIDG